METIIWQFGAKCEKTPKEKKQEKLEKKKSPLRKLVNT